MYVQKSYTNFKLDHQKERDFSADTYFYLLFEVALALRMEADTSFEVAVCSWWVVTHEVVVMRLIQSDAYIQSLNILISSQDRWL